MIILVDIDSTITNFGEMLLLANNQLHNTNYRYTDITSYDWFDQTFYTPWKPTEYQCFWNTVEVNPAAVTTIEKWVKQGYKVYLVTASHFNDMLGYKLNKTLEAFSPDLINERNVIVAQDKTAIHGDIMIDDCIDNLNSHTAFPICFAQPWNKDWKEDRTNDWEEIDKIVSNVAYHKKFF